MSINTQVTRISQAKGSLKTAINNKLTASQTKIADETLDSYTAFVNNIQTGGGGTDVSDTTATADKVLNGFIFHTAAGPATQGTIPTVTQPVPTVTLNSNTGAVTASYTPSAGYVSNTTAKESSIQIPLYSGSTTIVPTTSQQTLQTASKYATSNIIVNGDANLVNSNIKKDVSIFGVTGTLETTGVDVSDTTAVASDVLTGKYFYTSSGIRTEGTNTGGGSTAIINLAKVSTFSEAVTAISSINITGFTGEYVSWNGTYNVTADTASQALGRNRCYKHSTQNVYLYSFDMDSFESPAPETVSSFHWCFNTGKGYSYDTSICRSGSDENPTSGSYDDYMTWEGNQTLSMTYTWTQLSPRVLKGYDITGFSGGTFSLGNTEKNLTSSLTDLKTGYIYGTNGSTVLTDGPIAFGKSIIPSSNMVFYAPLASQQSTASTGQSMSYNGSYEFTTFDNMPCIQFLSQKGYIESAGAQALLGSAIKTISFWAYALDSINYNCAVGLGSTHGSLFNCGVRKETYTQTGTFTTWGNDNNFAVSLNDNKMHHYVFTWDGSKLYAYADMLKTNLNASDINVDTTVLRMGSSKADSYYEFVGYLANVRIYSRVLTDEEIANLYFSRA